MRRKEYPLCQVLLDDNHECNPVEILYLYYLMHSNFLFWKIPVSLWGWKMFYKGLDDEGGRWFT